MKIIEYEEIRLLKQSAKSTVQLVRETGGGRICVRKILKGRHPVYTALLGCTHPCLPVLYEVKADDDATIVIEEYIEGTPPDGAALSGKQLHSIVRELCSVLEFLHGKGIIHRDIKPSNLLLARDGHLRLIDFDAARMPKADLEHDTSLLGTRGYAPPEQYGFAQTDARSDIYSLGVTLGLLLGQQAQKPRYQKIIRKCTELDPDKRYQSIREVRRAFFRRNYEALSACVALLLIAAGCWAGLQMQATPQDSPDVSAAQPEELPPEEPALSILPAPEAPRWDGETGIGLWGNVHESGVNGEVGYHWRLYRRDTADPPDLAIDNFGQYGEMHGNGGRGRELPTYHFNLAPYLWENGFYYFAVSAIGDGVQYADSPYVLSDAFEYTGQNAPPLPSPTGLAWEIVEFDQISVLYATWSNLEDYLNTDSFNVSVYDQDGNKVRNNIWFKEQITSIRHGGIEICQVSSLEKGCAYRFTVQAVSSRPNEYQSSLLPTPIPEESFSPWFEPE